MIFGNVKTFRSCGLGSEDLDKYIEILKSVAPGTPPGRVTLDDGAFYMISKEFTHKPASEKQFEAHRKYIDIQYVFEGEEEIGYTDIENLTITQEFDEEKDCLLGEGDGVMLKLKAGDFAVFAPMDAHKPCCGNGTHSRKVIMKVPVK